jgi:tetratricopeptide (TPR) repeat protein
MRLFVVNTILFLTAIGMQGLCAQEETARAPGDLSLHRRYLDSANAVKKTDLKKSIDYITQSIASLGPSGNETEMALSLQTLGEVYLFHKQYDLAIDNLESAIKTHPTTKAAILLARACVLNGEFDKARETLLPLQAIKGMVPYQRVSVYEGLGDASKGLGRTDEALAYYKEGLLIAEKNQIGPKLPDLNSRIAATYAAANRLQEAKAYYDSSLEQAEKQAPARAVREKEKVADFLSRNNQYADEITLRKKSLSTLREIPEAAASGEGTEEEPGEVSPQGIAYKIANAYIAQNKYDEAIAYLQESIISADSGNDLAIQKDATRTLSEVYREKGEFNKALETYQQYVTLVDTLYRQKEQELKQAARLNREIAEKQSRITGLEQDRALTQSRYDLALTEQRLIQEQSKRQQWIIYSLLFGMFLLGLTTYFFYRSNRQQKLANNLLALKSLRTQMNPHFIFNALNSVNNYIAKKDERSANRFLSEFSTLMRAVLENSDKDFIPLERELELLGLYLKLEHSRFPEKFEYEIEISENLDTDRFSIPPMLLQPYLENAIWHGLRYKEGKGTLTLEAEQLGQATLRIVISDDGIGRRQSTALKTKHQRQQRSTGMENILKRVGILNEMHRDKISIEVRDLNPDGSGTRVELKLVKHQ